MYTPRQRYPPGSFGTMKGVLIVFVVFLLVIFAVDRLVLSRQTPGGSPATVVVDRLSHHDVKRATIVATTINLELKDGTTLRERMPADRDIWPLLQNSRADVAIIRGDLGSQNTFVAMLVQAVPLLLMALLVIFIVRRAQSSR